LVSFNAKAEADLCFCIEEFAIYTSRDLVERCPRLCLNIISFIINILIILLKIKLPVTALICASLNPTSASVVAVVPIF
jgi:hypothetical protein